MRLSNVFVQRRSLLQVEQLDVVVPGPVGRDIRRHGVEVDTLGGEDHAVLALIDGDLNSPVGHDIQALLVQGLTIGLIGGLTGLHDELIEVGILDPVGLLVGAALAVIDLEHIRVGRGLPCHGEHVGSTGVDRVDLRAATEHGIYVANVSDYCTEEVSNQALALLLMLARRIPQYADYVQAGKWYGKPWRYDGLKNQTVGVISYGKIARRFVEKMKPICDRIWVYDAFVPPEAICVDGVEAKSLDEILTGADYISIHCPLTEQTYHMFDRAAFEKMKPNAAIINVARGGLVDQKALLWAIENQRIRAAALDVLEQEPPGAENPLLGHDNIIITPHMGWFSNRAQQVLQATPAEEVVRVLQGGVPLNLVNRELLHHA